MILLTKIFAYIGATAVFSVIAWAIVWFIAMIISYWDSEVPDFAVKTIFGENTKAKLFYSISTGILSVIVGVCLSIIVLGG